MPPLHGDLRVPEWVAAFDAAYETWSSGSTRGDEPWLDPYAAEDPAEFFAVCAEMFFDVPGAFARSTRRSTSSSRRYFKQDLAAAA